MAASGLPDSDPEVHHLLSTLKSAAPLSRAAGTLNTYAGPWARFRAWCESKNTPYLPASPLTVLYLTKLWETAASPAPVLTASGAIFFHHSMAGLPSPTEHHLIKMVREFTRRTQQAGQNKKNPFLASHVRRLFSFWAGPNAPINKLMMTTAVMLCFAAFLRCDKLLSLQWEQIRFVAQTHMELFIEHQKTDQYRTGTWKIVARVGGACCPVALVERLLDEGRYAFLGHGALIRSSVVSGSRQYIKKDQPAYSTVSGWFREAALALGLDPNKYGTHSGRRGGATGAAAFEVLDRLFKEYGGWRSERAKDGYVVSTLVCHPEPRSSAWCFNPGTRGFQA